MSDSFEELVAGYPRIVARKLAGRLANVLNHAYGFRVSDNPDALAALGTEAAQDALEVLMAAIEIASGLGDEDFTERASHIEALRPRKDP
jgi:hypothetical protein